MTNPIHFTKPMKACDADLALLKFPIMVFPKIDGVRGLVIDGELRGRSLKAHKNRWIHNYLSDIMYNGLDGELAIANAETSQSLCRDTTSALNTINGEPEIDWHCFDYLTEATVNLPYLVRYDMLKMLVAALPMCIKVIDYRMCYDVEQVIKCYDACIARGYEGVVLRDPEAVHKNGRSTALQGGYLRIKPCGDAEGRYHHFDEAMHNGNEAKRNELGELERSSHKANKTGLGMIGAIWLTPVEGGEPFKVGPGKMTHLERIYFFQNEDELKGRYMKFKFFSHGAKDGYRHPRFISFRAESDMER